MTSNQPTTSNLYRAFQEENSHPYFEGSPSGSPDPSLGILEGGNADGSLLMDGILPLPALDFYTENVSSEGVCLNNGSYVSTPPISRSLPVAPKNRPQDEDDGSLLLVAAAAVLIHPALGLAFLAACVERKEGAWALYEDFDEDGYSIAEGDCADADPTMYPGAEDIWYNGIDENCDGASDWDADGDGEQSYWETTSGDDCDDADPDVTVMYQCPDDDGDGWGRNDHCTPACEADEGYVLVPMDEGGYVLDFDCDDEDPYIYPGFEEICDGLDNDCDDRVDEDLESSVFYQDYDGDGYGTDWTTYSSCDAPPGYTDNTDDCNDYEASISPAGIEVCDAEIPYADADCDGRYEDVGWTEPYYDDDCDGLYDNVGEPMTWYIDRDGDGYGDADARPGICGETRYTYPECTGDTPPTDHNYVANNADCDDSDINTFAYASEICDGFDNDCDDEIDEYALDGVTWYRDSDGDGYGDDSVTVDSCEEPEGYVANVLDSCEGADEDTSIYEGAVEVCDGKDNDCNGTVDDTADSSSVYRDVDRDGYGDPDEGMSVEDCDAVPSGYVGNDQDCDDSDEDINPDASEVCDDANTDEDCDGASDDDDRSVDTTGAATYYPDSDGDGYGDTSLSLVLCDDVEGYTTEGLADCDDDDPSVNPGAAEACNGIDDNCNEEVDEGLYSTYYRDADDDGYGDPSDTVSSCDSSTLGYVSVTGDCEDDDAAINPGAEEVCYDGSDNNCESGDEGDCAVSDDLTSFLYTTTDSMAAGYAVDADDQAMAVATDSSGAWVLYPPVSVGSNSSFTDAGAYFLSSDSSTDYTRAVTVGDVNNDGTSDVTVGALGVSSRAGAVYVVSGILSGSDVLSDAASVILLGPASSSDCGNALDSGMDADGDGISDLIVGCRGYDTVESNIGGAFLVSGPVDTTGELDGIGTFYLGDLAGDAAGSAVSFAGDVDGDGNADLLIGAPNNDGGGSSSGVAYLVPGGTVPSEALDERLSDYSFSVYGEAGDQAGISVSYAGDVDADGHDDFLVGAYRDDAGTATDSGSAFLFFGPLSGSSALDPYQVYADSTRAYAGYAVSGGGDVDCDGRADAAVGAYGADAVSVVTSWDGGSGLLSSFGYATGTTGSSFGYSVGAAGDVNGDGCSDVLIGAIGDDFGATNGGSVSVVYGGID